MTYPLPARRPAGDATGALSGKYPSPSLGSPLSHGLAMFDEFVKPIGASTFGDLGWSLTSYGGTPTVTDITPTAATEIGVCRITSPGVDQEGGFGGHDFASLDTIPIGALWCAKVRCSGATDHATLLSGLIGDFLAVPVGGVANNSFVGLRATDSSGGAFTWKGVVRDGTTEVVVDLGYAADSTWRILGFRRSASGLVQFFSVDSSLVGAEFRTDIGSPVASSAVPTGGLRPVSLGVISNDAAPHHAEIDFWSLGGSIAR